MASSRPMPERDAGPLEARPGAAQGSGAKRPAAPDAILRRLEWTVIRRLDGLLQGDYRTFFRGGGLDLADLREYHHHDDVRHIDWNVTARVQSPHVREFHADREATAWFLLDLSPSMDFGSGAADKRAMLLDFVTVMARVFNRQGNRVGALLYGGKVDRMVRPGSGKRHLLGLMHTLATHPVMPVAPTTQLSDLIVAAHRATRRRSVVFLVSDFISAPGWEKPLSMLAQAHEVTAVRLFDPLENELPEVGMVTIQDAETGEKLFVDTRDRAFRRRFEAAVEEREQALAQSFASAGVDVLEMATDDDLLDTLVRFAQMRKRIGAGGGASALPEHLRTRDEIPVA